MNFKKIEVVSDLLVITIIVYFNLKKITFIVINVRQIVTLYFGKDKTVIFMKDETYLLHFD